MKIAAVQMGSTPDRDANVAKACAYVEEAVKTHGAELVLLPEFFNTIYFAQYWDTKYCALAEPQDGYTMTAIRDCARKNKVHVIATIYEMEQPGLLFDTAMHVDPDGAIRFKFRKIHPAAVKSLEKLYFRYGSKLPTYAFGEWRVGIGICYDMMFPETARVLTVNGAELLLAPYATTRTHMYQEILRTRAFENGAYLVAANKVGLDDGWNFGGLSLIADPTGVVLDSADSKNEKILFAEIDREKVIEARRRFPILRDRRPDLYGPIAEESEDVIGRV
ncbi:MAG: carbon-nitrogen hydrolase family protein [Alphaproteobacteria bacterium]